MIRPMSKAEIVEAFYDNLDRLQEHCKGDGLECGRNNALTFYQHTAGMTAIYDEGLFTLTYAVSKLVGEAGEVAEKFGKLIRDAGLFEKVEIGRSDGYVVTAYTPNEAVLSDGVKQDLCKELGDVLWYVARIAAILEIDLADVALRNLEKLGSRLERGKLHGSGDDR